MNSNASYRRQGVRSRCWKARKARLAATSISAEPLQPSRLPADLHLRE
jgi:hypothetical protein